MIALQSRGRYYPIQLVYDSSSCFIAIIYRFLALKSWALQKMCLTLHQAHVQNREMVIYRSICLVTAARMHRRFDEDPVEFFLRKAWRGLTAHLPSTSILMRTRHRRQPSTEPQTPRQRAERRRRRPPKSSKLHVGQISKKKKAERTAPDTRARSSFLTAPNRRSERLILGCVLSCVTTMRVKIQTYFPR